MTIPTPPLIGVTSSTYKHKSGSIRCFSNQTYIQAIEKAGGLPLLIPVGIDAASLPELLTHFDGVLFTGGGDILPEYFRGENHPKISKRNPARDALEFELLKLSLEADLPLLAICRGIQVLNVGLGGTLYTHIQDQLPNAIKHDWYPGVPRDRLSHIVTTQPDSKLHQILGKDEIAVNSLHHQGINKLAGDLEAVAFASDGLIEAVELKMARFTIGVQWHPECLPDSSAMQSLFKAFIDACKR